MRARHFIGILFLVGAGFGTQASCKLTEDFGNYVASHTPLSCQSQLKDQGATALITGDTQWYYCNSRFSTLDGTGKKLKVILDAYDVIREATQGSCGAFVCALNEESARNMAFGNDGAQSVDRICVPQGDIIKLGNVTPPAVPFAVCFDKMVNCIEVAAECDPFTSSNACCGVAVCGLDDVALSGGRCCFDAGQKCSANYECCQGTIGCVMGTCGCVPPGQNCINDACCVGACSNGRCCSTAGLGCTTDFDCCDGGDLACGPSGTCCLVNGALSANPADCCAGTASQGICD
jgi:hypothetical protein